MTGGGWKKIGDRFRDEAKRFLQLADKAQSEGASDAAIWYLQLAIDALDRADRLDSLRHPSGRWARMR